MHAMEGALRVSGEALRRVGDSPISAGLEIDDIGLAFRYGLP